MKKLILLTAFMMITAITSAQIINVPGDYGTIQEGINAASNGQTVLVDTGTYYENINFKGKAIIVASNYFNTGDSSDIYNTVINGNSATNADSASTVFFITGEDTTSILYGFTITGGLGSKLATPSSKHGGGICGYNSGGKIIHNIISGNSTYHNSNAIGGGISFVTTSGSNWVVIKDNIIRNNQVEAVNDVGLGGGIYSSINTIICNNIIEFNTSISDSSECNGAGIGCHSLFTQEGVLLLNNNIIRYNNSVGYYANGVGVFVRYYTSTFINNKINYNSSIPDKYWGVGALIANPSGKTYILNNIFQENIGAIPASPGAGGGLTIRDPYDEVVVVNGNFFIDNVAKHGAGFYSRRPHNTVISNNVFDGDSAQIGGGIGLYLPAGDDGENGAYLQNKLPVVVNNVFRENKAQETGGAIRITGSDGDGLLTFNNIFLDNDAGLGGKDIYNNSSSYHTWIYYSNIDESNIGGLWNGENNFPGDPELIDDSCHINGGLCHNTGIHELEIGGTTYYAPETDIDGDSRPQGLFWDVGVDECLMTGIHQTISRESLFSLKTNPNPSSGALHLRYQISEMQNAKCEMYSADGVLVKTLMSGMQQPGKHELEFNVIDLPNGLYLIRLQAGMQVETAKVVLLK